MSSTDQKPPKGKEIYPNGTYSGPPGVLSVTLGGKAEGTIVVPFKQDPSGLSGAEIVVAPPRRSIWPILFLSLRLFELIFSTIVLGIFAADLYVGGSGSGYPKCVFFQTLTYPSDAKTIVINYSNMPNGNHSTCEFAISVAAVAIFISLAALIDSALMLLNYYVNEQRHFAFYVLEALSYLAIAMLWCATAIWTGIGYIATCNGRCDMAENSGVFAAKSQAIAGMVFVWLAMVPFSLDFGLCIRDFFRRQNAETEVFVKDENN